MTRPGDAMDGMEAALSDLQDEVAIAVEPPANHFRLKGFLFAVIVALCVAGATFFAVTQLRQVPDNARAIDKNCEQRNRQLAAVNEKFQQLNLLVEARLRDRPDGSPNPPDVLAAFEKLRQPIPAVVCTSLSMRTP